MGKIKLSKNFLMQRVANRAKKSKSLRSKFNLLDPVCNDFFADCCGCCNCVEPRVCCRWHCCQKILGFIMTIDDVGENGCGDCTSVNGYTSFVPTDATSQCDSDYDNAENCESCECGAIVEPDGYKGGFLSGSWVCAGGELTPAYQCGSTGNVGVFRWRMICTGHFLDGGLIPDADSPATVVVYSWNTGRNLDLVEYASWFPGPQPACPTTWDSTSWPYTQTNYGTIGECILEGAKITMTAVYAP